MVEATTKDDLDTNITIDPPYTKGAERGAKTKPSGNCTLGWRLMIIIIIIIQGAVLRLVDPLRISSTNTYSFEVQDAW